MIEKINEIRREFDGLFLTEKLNEKDHRKIVKSFDFMIKKIQEKKQIDD